MEPKNDIVENKNNCNYKPVVTILLTEYQTLINNNDDLKKEISRLKNNEIIFQNLILNKDKSIEELKEENIQLTKKLELLKNQVNNLFEQNSEIKKENSEIKKENRELKINVKNLTSRLDNIENKNIFKKYIIAIQNLNRYDKLETNIPDKITKKQLNMLRNKRIGECHYIDDDENIKDCKRTILKEEIDNMLPAIQDKFNDKYPNLLNNIIGYIEKNKTNPTKELKNEMKDWFYDN